MARGKRNADEQLLLALACGASDEQAALKSGLSVRTVYRRKGEPDFHRRLQALRADMMQRAGGILVASTIESAKTFVLLQKEAVPYPTRLGAARSVMQYAMKMCEFTELEKRMAALEEQVAATPAGG
jgi:hypothetical protein